MEEVKSWNEAAEDYQKVFKYGLNEYNKNLLAFFVDNGLLRPGCRVLDIGCGVGKYGTYFAELGCDVTLTDISPVMLEHAAENMSVFDTPWRSVQGDFAELEPEALSGGERFDLSISMMSPAVRELAGVKKMSSLTRGWCFTASFVEWKQEIRDEFYRRMGIEQTHSSDITSSAPTLIREVSAAGFTPLVKYVPYDWCDERSPGEAAEYLMKRSGREYSSADLIRAEEVAAALADERGVFIDSVNTKVVWIYWNTEG